MADIVASTLVQEGVSGVSSYVSNKLEEKASTSHMVARLEMALSQLEFALERTGKLPITYVSLLRRRKLIKQAYIDGTCLLNKYKLQLVDGHKETTQLATGSSFLERVIHAVKLSVSSLIGLNMGYLTSSSVQIFEYYADCATNFVREVESGNPLQHVNFGHRLVRHLLEGKNLMNQVMKGSQACFVLGLFPIHQEDRGVEAALGYTYVDMDRPEQCFHLGLLIRLSEDTDLVGITIKCLQLLTSRFKLVTESAIGELTLLSPLPDIAQTDTLPMSLINEKYGDLSKLVRQDPVCCTNDVVSSDSSFGALESVIGVYLEYVLHSSPGEVCRNAPPLYLTALFAPHACATQHQQGFVLNCGVKEEHIGGSIQQVEEILRLKVEDCVLHQPGPMLYYVSWYSAHGAAWITLGNEQAYPKPTAARRRRRMVLDYGGKEEGICDSLEINVEVQGKSNVLDSVIQQAELTHNIVKWYYSEHAAHYNLCGILSNELACPELSAAPSSSRGAVKRKR
ncbi:hypothetical protein ACP4OV_011834 [Aristida adscensionis]